MESNENNAANPNAWVFFADNNINVAENIIEDAELAGEVAFNSQQAVEKYIKAFLTKNNIPFKKTHDLIELYLKVKAIKDWDIDEIILESLNDLYIETRYPSNIGFFPDHSLPTIEDAMAYLDFARKV